MSQQQQKCLLSFGKHATAGDSVTVPSLLHRLPERHTFMRPGMVRLPRQPYHPSNQGFAPMRGPLDISGSYELEQILRGLSGNAGGAITATAATDVADVLDVVAGTDAIDPAGASTTVTTAGSDGSTKTLVVAEQARFPVGTVLMFEAPAGTFHVRQVRARAGSSGSGALTLDRTWTGTVANGTTPARFSRWKFDPAVFEHKHGTFRTMYGTDDGETFIGGMAKAVLDFSRGRFAKLITTWQFSDVQRATGSVPSFSAMTAGNGVVRVSNALWVNDDPYYAMDVKVDCGGEVAEKPVDAAVHGRLGFVVHKGGDKPRPKIMATILRGSSTGEIAEGSGTLSLQNAQGYDLDVGEVFSTADVAFQAGGVAAGCSYNVMRQAVLTKAEPTEVNGLRALSVEWEATGLDADLAPFETHLG